MSDNENDGSLETEIRRSSRRREPKKGDTRKSALDAMKEARRSGKVHRVNVDELIQDVYHDVDEDEYNEIVRKRQAEDFVVDDDGNGYVDHGADFFYEEEEEVDQEKKKRKKKDKSEPAKKGGLANYFSATAGPVRSKVKDDTQVKLDDDEDLRNMLAGIGDEELDLDYEAPTVTVRPTPGKNPFKREHDEDSFDAPRPKALKLTAQAKPSVTPRNARIEVPHSSLQSAVPLVTPIMKQNIQVDMELGDFCSESHTEIDDFDDDSHIRSTQSMINEDKEEINMVDDEKLSAKSDKESPMPNMIWDWEETVKEEKEENQNVTEGELEDEFYLVGKKDEEEKPNVRIRMYWLDAFEDPLKMNGMVHLFGKVVRNSSSEKYSSCCIVVKNISRQVFFLKRDKRMVNGIELDEDVSNADVHAELTKSIFPRHCGTSSFRCREVKKKFTSDGTLSSASDEEIDATDVIEVQYGSSFSRLPADLQGETFSAVYNTTTTAMERLLVEKGMMGPGWINISNFVPAAAKTTYCDFEFSVDMERMQNIEYDKNGTFPPLMRMLALNVVTTLNEKKENEICMISTLYNPKCNLNNPTSEQKYLSRMCLVTKPNGTSLPFDLTHQLKLRNLNEIVCTANNEKALLTLFLAKLEKYEPDLLVGHDLTATMSILTSRLDKHKVQGWSRTSRLRRTIPIGKIAHNKAGHWELTAGRLLVDSKISSMELVRSRSYDLTELSSQLLSVSRDTVYANEVAAKYSHSHHLIDLMMKSWNDPYLSLRIICQLNAIPLAIQITNIVGGVTSRTLMGGRAERNEYLLLHAFHRGNFIAPNKYQPNYKKSGEKKKEEGKEGDEEVAVSKNKAQYSGGLVLEPKKGLYDTLILLLDFNSLYPSIIQEFNICFTTVPHVKDGDEVPDVPAANLNEGILPKEIRGLVEMRREVKALMKAKNCSEEKKKQYDIRQMALKLTANSMYGCLGFQQSRFYAKPLAALVTSKGRDILMQTKELVEKLGYTVIYGDTDSIMINTNSLDLQNAKKLGYEIKQHVNKCHKMLELDLDGVFKRMLLLKKKKYAALLVNLENDKEYKKEMKGLDIVRRDWSSVSKEAGTDILDFILDPLLSRDELIAKIHESLSSLRIKFDNGEIPLEMFQISKQLTRNPRDYHDIKSQPHATVALRLNQSGKFTLSHGDVVEYIICEDGTTNAATQRAYHRTEIESNPQLKIDKNYYLAHQVHPVVTRLCAPLEETDPVRIAEALGLDSTSYRRQAIQHSEVDNGVDDEWAWQGPLTYDHCEAFTFKCPAKCGHILHIRESLTTQKESELSLTSCDKCGCQLSFYSAYIQREMEKSLSDFITRHLNSMFKCDDSTCEFKTSCHMMKWCREGLECPRCTTGILRKEYTLKDLFDQQTFFRQIVDAQSAVEQLKPDARPKVQSRAYYGATLSMCCELTSIVDFHLDNNAYNQVDLAYIFAPMLKL